MQGLCYCCIYFENLRFSFPSLFCRCFEQRKHGVFVQNDQAKERKRQLCFLWSVFPCGGRKPSQTAERATEFWQIKFMPILGRPQNASVLPLIQLVIPTPPTFLGWGEICFNPKRRSFLPLSRSPQPPWLRLGALLERRSFLPLSRSPQPP